ncbi:MAG TPA: hypothetical protein VJY39_23460 [Acidisphaera sp.]|nr:hypothetical protein [Acidisphaera sp.]
MTKDSTNHPRVRNSSPAAPIEMPDAGSQEAAKRQSVERQLTLAEMIMREDREILRKLADA